MFTGIVDHCGSVSSIEKRSGELRLSVEHRFGKVSEGESISVDGACLTAVMPSEGSFFCDLSIETVERTVSAQYTIGQRVNLERALTLSDRLGGYLLTGHVEHIGTIESREIRGDCVELVVGNIPENFSPLLLPKGNISVQGVSLTINEVLSSAFRCLVIPHTLERTNLKDLQRGDFVNLEFDWITKVIAHQVRAFFLSKQGNNQ